MLSKAMQPGLTTLEQRVGRLCGLIDEMKGEAIVVLDLRGMCDFADAFVIATTRSRTHMQGVALRVVQDLRQEGMRPLAKPDLASDRWTAIDYGDVIVHLFDADGRQYYSLEQLWGDAPELAWQQPAMA
jgi:ribosome-associated protein